MSRQSLKGNFRQTLNEGLPVGINLADQAVDNSMDFPGGTILTQGATQIDTIQGLGPAINQKWKVIAVSITAYLYFSPNLVDAGFNNFYGRLGKIRAGLFVDDPPPATGPYVYELGEGGIQVGPFSVPMETIEIDQTLAADLFDPSVDELPPTPSAVSAPPGTTLHSPNEMLPVQATINPPIAIELFPGINVAIGIWMIPSIIGGNDAGGPNPWAFVVSNAGYSITYDNGI